MGYITDIMTPVKMFSGTKSLIFNTDGTYSILFVWNDSVLKKINQELLHNFTKNFFRNYSVEVKNNGILMLNLSEDFAFLEKVLIFSEYMTFNYSILTPNLIKTSSSSNHAKSIYLIPLQYIEKKSI